VRHSFPDGVDGVYDTAAITTAAVPAIRDGGVIAVVRGWDGPNPERDVQVRRVSVGNALQNTQWLRLLADEAAAARIQLRVADTYEPHEAEAAYLRTEVGGMRGRAVIRF